MMRTGLLIGTLALTAVSATADELPHRKAGLWQITMQSGVAKRPPMVQRLCLDRETEALLYRTGIETQQQACAKSEIHATATEVRIKASCTMGASHMTSEATTSLTSDVAYHTAVHATFDPPLFGSAASNSTQDGKWLGACPADMKPGDLIMQTSGPHAREIRMNLRDLGKKH